MLIVNNPKAEKEAPLRRVASTQIRAVFIVALLLGLVFSGVQVFFDFKLAQKSFSETIKQAIDTARKPAAAAIYQLDSYAALVVIQGILEFEVIVAADIKDEFGTVLAHQEKTDNDWSYRTFSDWLMGPPSVRTIELASDLPDLVSSGQLTVVADPYSVAVQFLGDSVVVALSELIRTTVLAGMLFWVFFKIVTRPLQQITDAVINASHQNPLESKFRLQSESAAFEFIQLTDATNRLLSKLGTELSQRLETFEKLSHSESMLSTVVTHAPIILWAIDSEGVFTLSEGQGLEALNLKPREIIGTSVMDLYADRSDILSDIRRVLLGETFSRVRDANDAIFHTHYAPVVGDDGSVLGALGVSVDITERAQSEERIKRVNLELEERVQQRTSDLERANKAKSDFLAKMSHELRTPLNAIIGISEMLLEEALENPATEDAEPFERIKSAGDHLLLLINDILDISRIEADRITLSPQDFSISDLCDELRSTFSDMASANNNRLEAKFAEDIGSMRSDRGRIKQVLINLLSNACKFTENGKVSLCAQLSTSSHSRSGVLFEVVDTGIGIPAEMLANIFDEFQQADNSISRRFGGTGLGLAISKNLTELLGGEISVGSRPGEGSWFNVWFPMVLQYEVEEDWESVED